MKRFTLISVLLASLLLCLGSWQDALPDSSFKITKETTVWEVFTRLGKIKPNILDEEKLPIDAVQKGIDLATQGRTTEPNGSRGRKISRHFVCLDCHSTQREYSDLSVIDPQSRLLFADSMQRPFLPGPPLLGLVNRVLFFNDDFQKEWKEDFPKVEESHRDLRAAINVCNQSFGEGRELKAWEVESLLAYFWTLELKMRHLPLTEEEVELVEQAVNTNRQNLHAVNVIREHYVEVYPAHLVEPLPVEKRRATSPVVNDFKNGERVYELSCLYCHQDKRRSRFKLDREQRSFQFLKKHFDDGSKYSIYDVIRYHPGSKGNERSRMPHYTAERMSDHQIQDLRYYITRMAKYGDEGY